MNTTIYATTKRRNRKSGGKNYYKFAFNDDPYFCAFRECINTHCQKNGLDPIPDSMLYRLWYETKNFRTNWDSQYNKETAQTLILTLGRTLAHTPGLVFVRSQIILMQWIKRTYPNITDVWWNEWKEKVFDVEWRRNEPKLIEQFKQAKAKRKEKYNMKKGRPIKDDSLRNKIIAKLKEGRSTPELLAKDLAAPASAVESAIWRLKGKGDVVKVAHGLYALPEGK